MLKGEMDMVIALIGESCTGKTTIAQKINEKIPVKIITGKDYLRMAKNETVAEEKFKEFLASKKDSEDIIIYVISEKEFIKFLPSKTIKILCKASLSIIKKRFSERMHGNLLEPVVSMLEKRHGQFMDDSYELIVDTSEGDTDVICEEIYCKLKNNEYMADVL